MADPLSIAATVVGLIGTTVKISKALSDIVSSVSDARQTARIALESVEGMRAVLQSVQGLFDTFSSLPSERKILIRLDYIVATFYKCVITLSELESLICGQLVKEGGLWNRLRWVWRGDKVLRLLPLLESQKNCLTLMLSVLQWYRTPSPWPYWQYIPY
jgi:hypothetical protein